MQITPVQVPVVNTNPTPQTMAQVMPTVAAQAVAPIGARAVDPSDRSGKKQKPRSNNEKSRGGDAANTDKRGGAVNISV